jgi:hypothetical protein
MERRLAVNTRNYLKGLLLSGICIALCGYVAMASDHSTGLNENHVTLQKVKTFFDAALMNAKLDQDGDLLIEDGGFKTYVKLDKEKKMITFFSLWGLRDSVPETAKLELVNNLNRDLIFVRFSMPRTTVLYCDYQFLYGGGITPQAVLNNYRLYARVVKGAVLTRDPKDIIK